MKYCDTSKLSIRQIDKPTAKKMVVKYHYSKLWTKCSVALGLFHQTGNEHSFFDEPEEKIKITKMAWETKGVRSVKNAITIKGQTNFKNTAKDILITSQLRTALIFNKKTKARNYTLETVNKNIYIFGIAMDEEEEKEVINEANKIYDVEEVIPSIYLATELSRTKF